LADPQPATTDPLAGLIDIPLPPEVSLLPQTWPSRIAIALLAISTILCIWHLVHRFRANAYRREALRELMRITSAPDRTSQGLAAELAILVRRTALDAFPRETVAPLSGAAWLAFLDRSYGGDEFSQGAGRLLASAPYQRAPAVDDARPELVMLVRRWIKVHHA
jgi:Ca-activated chloride channel family protein